MMQRLAPYGSSSQAINVSKVGKSKASAGLAERMPSAAVAAKVGGDGMVAESGYRVRRLKATV